jgi:hypothetical protein
LYIGIMTDIFILKMLPFLYKYYFLPKSIIDASMQHYGNQ